jgi:DNA-binding transcriptional MocR family regulator
VLRRRREILADRAARLGRALAELEAWLRDQLVEWVRPDGGAICCLRLRTDEFTDAAVDEFHARLATCGVRVARGAWFGEDDRVFRLGFGYLAPEDFTEALSRLAQALKG